MKTFRNKNKNRKEFYLENLVKFCDKCGVPYSLDNLEIIQDSGSSVLMHFHCKSCKSENVASFLSSSGLTTKIPINSDLSLKEIKEFSAKSIVSLDEVLDVYVSLKYNEGYIEI